MKKLWNKVFCLILAIVLIITIKHNFIGYNYESAESCAISSFNTGADLVYVYENNSIALVTLNSSGDYYTCYCKKLRRGDSFAFKRVFRTNMIPPVTYTTEWNKVNKDLYFIYVDYKNDIEKIDCMNYEPIGSYIKWTNAVGEIDYCWLYIIDKTGSGEVKYANGTD